MKNQSQKIGSKSVVGHTPTPWVNRGPNSKGHYVIGEVVIPFRMTIADVFREANAEFIVKAVNTHEALLIALEDMSHAYHQLAKHEDYLHKCTVPWCVENRRIIAEAGGKI